MELFDDAEKYGVNKNQLLHVKRLFITEHVKRLSVSGLGLDNFRLNDIQQVQIALLVVCHLCIH